MTAWILVKYGMGGMPLEASRNSYFLFHKANNASVTDAQTCDVGA
jgi:hypothetical protein